MKDKVTLLSNFICSSKVRFAFLEQNTPKVAEVMGKWPCVINFDIKNKYTEKVKRLYESNFQNLVFENEVGTLWRDWMVEKLEKIETPYVMYPIEDVEFFDIFTHKILNQMLIDMKKFDVKHLLFGKVQKYRNILLKGKRDKDTEVRHFWYHESVHSPYQQNSLTISALFERNFLLAKIKEVKPDKDTIKVLDNFERLGIRGQKIKVAIPNQVYIGEPKNNIPMERNRN